ncbi:antA/AntB antirepressor family protein [Bacteroides neonati]|uniref:antA/AntB antirepressor family protein n=1 Tax=Bacteroides neonati TaxID=1347393 RepID=UPI0004ACFDEB|nr:antA/AntB antirepressor family protein [Bacteroides neonati]
MNELIKITERDGKKAVSARELHSFLESKQEFANWIKNRIDKYDLVENVDFVRLTNLSSESQGRGGLNRVDYVLSVDAAKELSMVEGNEKGKQARKYFIKMEEIARKGALIVPDFSNPAEAARAWADEYEKGQRANLLLEEKTKQLDESKEWFSIKRWAKDHGMNWRKISWRVLKALSFENGYEVKKVFDANYGQVNIYHKDVFLMYSRSIA